MTTLNKVVLSSVVVGVIYYLTKGSASAAEINGGLMPETLSGNTSGKTDLQKATEAGMSLADYLLAKANGINAVNTGNPNEPAPQLHFEPIE